MTAEPHGTEPNKELHQLLVAAVMGDMSRAERERLNDLLANNRELRHQASRFLEEEAILREQFEVLGRIGEFHSPPVGLNEVQCAPAGVDCHRSDNSWARRFALLVFAASLLMVAGGGGLWRVWDAGASANAESNEPDAALADDVPQTGIAALRPRASLPRVVRVSWSGPQFAIPDKAIVSIGELREGVIDFTAVDGRPAKGYVVHLPPGAMLDVVVAAEANAENALAVIEFDRHGRPTGPRKSFSNSTADGTALASRNGESPTGIRVGPLGVFTEQNNDENSRFFLFTCVHKRLGSSPDDAWLLSNLSVMVADDNFVHLGWDDSGITRNSDGEQVPDEDFNDLSATIRIHGRTPSSAETPSAVRVLAGVDSSDDSPIDDAENDGYAVVGLADDVGLRFDVAPGEVVVVKLTNRAWVPIWLTLVDEQTGRQPWRCLHMQPRFANVGICAVENSSPRTRRFRLVCRYLAADGVASAAWQSSAHEVLFKQDAFMTVGFENGHLDGSTEDVKADLITMEHQ